MEEYGMKVQHYKIGDYFKFSLTIWDFIHTKYEINKGNILN